MKRATFIFLVSNLLLFDRYKVFAQAFTSLPPTSIQRQGEQLEIQYSIPISASLCQFVKSVEVTAITTGKSYTASQLTGELYQLQPGTHTLYWNYKADTFFEDDEISVRIFLTPCATKPASPAIRYRPQPMGLKLAVGGVGLAAGGWSYLVYQNYTTKLEELNRLEQTLPQVGGKLLNGADLATWKTAYEAAQQARKPALLNSLIAVAGVATIAEAFLWLTKRKINPSPVISLVSTSDGIGIRYIH